MSSFDARGPLARQTEADLAKFTTAFSDDGGFVGFVGSSNGAFQDIDDWGEPEPIPTALPPVPPLDPELLPAALRPAAEDIAERMQVPLDFPGAALVVALAGVTGRRIEIQPKALDTGWKVTPNLWGAIVARPGFMKSPLIDDIARPLREIEARWGDEYRESMEPFEREAEEHKLRLAAWSESFKAGAKKGGGCAVEHPGPAPEAPGRRRLVVNDSSPEALHAVMAANPAGVLVLRDELTGWLASLDRQGNEGSRAFYLEAWNGSGSYVVDRIARGNLEGTLCASLFGGIQPSKLQAYVSEAINGYGGDDGLIQRLQVVVWPDAPSAWRLVDRPPDFEALGRVRHAFERIAALQPDEGRVLRFDPAAQALFFEWLGALEHRIRGDELHPAMASHLSKYRSLMPSLAGLFALVDWAAVDTGDEPPERIGLDYARRAAAWCDYLEAHAGRVYASLANSQWMKAADLGRKLKAGKLGDRFTVRSLYLRGWAGLATPGDARQACEALAELGWLRRTEADPGPGGGRPSEEYKVNPRVQI